MKAKNATNCRNCLQDSLSVDLMLRFAKLVDPDYDIYERTGIRVGLPIPLQSAARCIVEDMMEDGRYIDFVEVLVKVDREGYMGSRFNLKGLNGVVDCLIDEGFNFDKVSGHFFENQQEHISPNWGRLLEGDERKMTLLRLDIVGNSELVRNNPRPKIEQAYNDVRNIVNKAVNSRIGRLWSWEGDGALAAFLFGPIEKMAIFAGMDILHELFFYNKLRNPLDSPINVRIGAHIGQVRYSNREMERLKNETIKQVMVYEALASSNTLSVSFNVYISMDPFTLKLFSGEKIARGCKYRLYAIEIEK